MLKNIFFKVMALLCPKNNKGLVERDNKSTRNTKANGHVALPPTLTAKHLELLLALVKSEIRLAYLKRKALERNLLAVFFLLVSFTAQSQLVVPLSIGDKVPATILNTSFPVFGNQYKLGDSIKLSNYKGKIILLDFWATWCSTCIYKFPVLEQLQQKYAENLAVILVDTKNTKDTPKRIEGILSGANASYQKSNLFTIYGDTLLMKFFPHRYLPHYVWIGADGTLKLLSAAEMLNVATIIALLPNQHLTTPKK